MTQSLSAEEIANGKLLEERRRDDFRFDDWCVRNGPTLLAMASRLGELESALVYLYQNHAARFNLDTGEEHDLTGRNVIRAYAKLSGWPGPTSQAKGG